MRSIYRFAAAKVIASAACLAVSGVFAQEAAQHIDPVITLPEMYSVLLENEHVRVVEYRIDPGQKDDWHTHPPKVSYVVSGGMLKITLENEESFIVEEGENSASWLGAVGRHFVENVGDTPVRIVLVEIKSIADQPFEAIADPD